MLANGKADDRADRRVSDRRAVDIRLDRILAVLEHLKNAMITQEYKLENNRWDFLKAMKVIYGLKLAADSARADARRRETTIEEMGHRLATIEQTLQGMRNQRRLP